MNKYIFFIITFAVLFTAYCLGNPINNEKKIDPVESLTLKKTISDYNKFALYLYSRLAFKQENALVSPLSVMRSLAVLYELSEKQTKDEMMNDLYFNEDKLNVKTDFSFIQFFLKKNKLQNVDFISNESIWIDSRFKIDRKILKEIKKYYGDILFNQNFQNDYAKSLINLNKWLRLYKSDKDTNLLPDNFVSDKTRMLILTVAHLNAIWEEGFDTTKIEKGIFNKNKQNVKFLTKIDSFYCHDNPVMQIIEIPLKNNIFSFLIFLPRHTEDFDYVESVINHENYYKTQRAPYREKISLRLPSFKILSKQIIKSVFKKYGMPSFFQNNAAFSGYKSKDSLNIDEVYQQSFVSIGDKGNKMPVANNDAISKRGLKTFDVNRPFIFIIRENTYNTILFIGKVFDPIQ